MLTTCAAKTYFLWGSVLAPQNIIQERFFVPGSICYVHDVRNDSFCIRVQIGWTALHLASATGQLPMVEMLVEKGGTDLLMAKDSTVRRSLLCHVMIF
jgi:hypothetical protein